VARGRPECEHLFALIVCVLLPRFELAVAAGGRAALLEGPAALAPEPGRGAEAIGEVSRAAEAAGVVPGMRLGEALARCPALALVPPDPVGVQDAWEEVLTHLEGIGAEVETSRPGVACFAGGGLRRLHGGSQDGVVRATRAALRRAARIGSGPSRFSAIVAAERARARHAGMVRGADDLAPAPVGLLRRCQETAHLPEALERFGIETLGALAALSRSAVADRFGRPGLRAHDLARGEDTPLVPRSADERLEEGLELEESASGSQLGRALELLVDRLLARRERRGRTVRVAVLSATLVEGGTWRERVVFREPLADPTRMVLALGRRLETLPAPADALRLSAERLGPPHAGGRALFDDGAAQRAARLREAIRQARAVAGPDAALRVLAVDPDSRVPERRVVLTPFEP
jgi:nucleotidyltransferase/DNA polymerase involved in DNA repair